MSLVQVYTISDRYRPFKQITICVKVFHMSNETDFYRNESGATVGIDKRISSEQSHPFLQELKIEEIRFVKNVFDMHAPSQV